MGSPVRTKMKREVVYKRLKQWQVNPLVQTEETIYLGDGSALFGVRFRRKNKKGEGKKWRVWTEWGFHPGDGETNKEVCGSYATNGSNRKCNQY